MKVLSMNLTGTVGLPARRQGARHRADGILRSQLPISDLEILEEKPVYLKKTARQTTKGKMKMGKSMSVSPEINLLGKTVDEAVRNWTNTWTTRRLPTSPRCALSTAKAPAPCARASTTTCAARRNG